MYYVYVYEIVDNVQHKIGTFTTTVEHESFTVATEWLKIGYHANIVRNGKLVFSK